MVVKKKTQQRPMKKSALIYRMYGFVPYNISGRQAGIQNHHASAVYSAKYHTPAYKQWALKDGTIIMLDGGTTNNSKPSTMTDIVKELVANKVKHTLFYEEDLNDALTGISLLVSSQVFDRKTYPGPFENDPNPVLAKIELIEPSKRFDGIMGSFDLKRYKEWAKNMGPMNVFLRYYLPKFKLANN